MLNQSNAKQQAYSNAANNATTQGASVAQGLYGMNLSNANLNNSAAQQTLTSNLGIMGGLNSAIPGAAQYNQQAVPGADLLGAANAANANTVAANNASIASSNATKGGLFQLGGSALIAASDIRLKKNIKRIGTHALGIGIYAYDYIWDKSAIGVMAQEVLKVKPEAVIIMPNGYYAVNYGAL